MAVYLQQFPKEKTVVKVDNILSPQQPQQESLLQGSVMSCTLLSSILILITNLPANAIPLQDLQLLCIHELRGISKKRIIAIIQGRNMSDSSGSEDEEEEEELRQASKSTKSRRRNTSSKAKNSPDPSKPMDIVELEMRARLIQTMLKKDPKNKTIPPLDDIKAQIKSEPLSDHSYSSSRSVSRSRSYSSRSYSCSSSSRSSSYSDSEGRRKKRRSGHRSRRRGRRGRRRKSYRDLSKKRDSSHEDSAATATPEKNGSDEKRRQTKKTKISRKEFEDRMKRAKENRTYRKRTDSEDETTRGKERAQSDDGAERSTAVAQKLHERTINPEGKADIEKEPAEDESEKEEGEIDSNEDEEAGAYFSGEGSPRKKKSRRSRSFSSISSLSGTDRSRSGWRSKRGKDKKHRRRKEHRMPVDKNLIHATLNDGDSCGPTSSSKKSRSKAGIEAVDSEEDFDSLGNGNKREVVRPDASVGLRTDRSNVSFSFNKKTAPSLMSGTDFEFGMSYSAPPPSGPLKTPPLPLNVKKSVTNDQIVISSDSESEKKPTKKVCKNNAENMSIEEDINDGAMNISDQNDLKLCEETVMKDIFDDMEEEEEEEQCNKGITRPDVPIKAEPTDHSEKDDFVSSVDINRSDTSYLSTNTAGVSVKRELNSPEETQSIDCSFKRKASVAQQSTRDQDSEEGACSDEDSDSVGKTPAPRSFVNSFQAASVGMKSTESGNRPYTPSGSDAGHKKSNGDTCNGSNEEDEDVGLVDLPEDEHFALDVVDEDSNSQTRYEDTIDPVAEGGDDSEVTADKTDFYRGVENFNASEDNSLSANQESQVPVASGQKSESEEEGEIEEDAGLVELEPGEAEELSGLATPSSTRARVHQGGTEIIGEIEPSSRDGAGLENLGESGSSWSSRWLQSEKVQKVVTSSKMLSRMRKRIKIDKINAKAGASATAAGETGASEAQKSEENTSLSGGASLSASVPVINSMEEYKKLLGKTDAAPEGITSASSDAAAAGGSDKKDEDDEASSDDSDEDLWSKMMGN
ncbi:hypothetical protein FHG87_012763 [Trinorchestia longiramus]|nr:hypothetical protein FHG87_012763 [Trinorchestia longiramus]